jgi:hypothetical protein
MRVDRHARVSTTILPQSVTSPRRRCAVAPTFLSAGSRDFPVPQAGRLESPPNSPAGKPPLRGHLRTVREIPALGRPTGFGVPKIRISSVRRSLRSRQPGFPRRLGSWAPKKRPRVRNADFWLAARRRSAASLTFGSVELLFRKPLAAEPSTLDLGLWTYLSIRHPASSIQHPASAPPTLDLELN